MSDVSDNPNGNPNGNPHDNRGNPQNPYPQTNVHTPVAGPAKFCAGCGTGLVASAAVCPNCGSPTGAGLGPGGKDKTVAVLLAVFLGPWTWLYTYSRNALKFWVGLGVGVGAFVVAGIVAGVTASRFNSQVDPNAVMGAGVSLALFGLAFFVWFGFHIWAIIDVAVAPPTFYRNYPNG